jgi:hypothetical protein
MQAHNFSHFYSWHLLLIPRHTNQYIIKILLSNSFACHLCCHHCSYSHMHQIHRYIDAHLSDVPSSTGTVCLDVFYPISSPFYHDSHTHTHNTHTHTHVHTRKQTRTIMQRTTTTMRRRSTRSMRRKRTREAGRGALEEEKLRLQNALCKREGRSCTNGG